MADTLEIFGDEFANVTGIKATNGDNEIVIFYNLDNGDNMGYGGSLNLAVIGTGQIGTGRVV